jgi:anaerobic magnesium-protoporphyrin IX monomethyl ester cyclase
VNILVINIALRPNSPVKLFPIGLGYICTAMHKAGHDFDLIDIDAHRYSDEEIRRLIGAQKYDVACLGAIVTGYPMIKDLAATIRSLHPHCKIIVGNSVAHSTEMILNKTSCDIAVLSEADLTIVELLDAIAQNTLLDAVDGICYLTPDGIHCTEPRKYIKDLSTLPEIAFELFDADLYADAAKNIAQDPLPMPREKVRALPVNTARGCIANCTFCYHVFKKKPYRVRPAEKVITEIRGMIERYDLNMVFVSDELTLHNKKRALELADGIIESGLKFIWRATCRADLFDSDDDVDIILRLKEAGCIGIGYSLENADQAILKAMNKRITLDGFEKQTEIIRKAGLPVSTSLVFGYPQETPSTINSTIDACVRTKCYPSVGYLLPQPGSVMYEYAKEHGFIGDEEQYLLKMGDRQDLKVNLTEMSDQEFQSIVQEGLERCAKELKVGLSYDSLIKTQHQRSPYRYDEDGKLIIETPDQ